MASNPLAQLQRRKKEIQKRLVELQKELKEIERVEKGVLELAAKLTPVMDDTPDDGDSGPSRVRSGARPAQIIKAVKDILLNSPHPMSRGELLKRLAADGIEIIGSNPANTLGTTLSRAPNVFVNLKGFGYWLRIRVYSLASYHPGNAEKEEAPQEPEQTASLPH